MLIGTTAMEINGFPVILITGILVIVLSCTLDRLWAIAMPYRTLYLFIRFPGIVLHECSHIFGCLLTGARIRKVVLFSKDGGSVTYARPGIPYIGDVIISTAPLFLLPLILTSLAWIFGTYLGCIFPAFPAMPGSAAALAGLLAAIFSTVRDNLVTRFNGWFLLYLYFTISLVLSVAPSMQDMKNAATGLIFLILAGALVVWIDIPVAAGILAGLMRLLGHGFMLGLVYGLTVLVLSLPLLFLYVFRNHL